MHNVEWKTLYYPYSNLNHRDFKEIELNNTTDFYSVNSKSVFNSDGTGPMGEPNIDYYFVDA